MEEEEIERAAQTFYPPQHTRAEEIEDEEAYLRVFQRGRREIYQGNGMRPSRGTKSAAPRAP